MNDTAAKQSPNKLHWSSGREPRDLSLKMHLRTARERLAATARVFALAGGALLSLMAALVVVSIVGRVVFGRPVAGGFEIVAMGTAISAFLCLPYCHWQRGNVVVNLFFSDAAKRLTHWLDAVAATFYGAIAMAFAWRMSAGLVDAIHYQDISVIIGLPLWWAYPPAIASFLLLAASCAATAFGDFKVSSK
jgi:TRAP-type C4-dicarboxylate transport system permease small subunit